MAVITRVGSLATQNTGTTAVPSTNPPGASAGDKMIRVITVSATAASISNLSGWTLLADVTYNSRRTFFLTRDYAASYPDIVLSTGATAGGFIAALRAAAGYTLGAVVAGTKWDRPADGGGTGFSTTMKSMTGAADGIVLAITAETSTTPETEAQVTFSGTGWAKWFYADADAASDVAANFWVGYRDLGASASGDAISTWPNTSTNSVGIQLAIGQTGGPSDAGNVDVLGTYNQLHDRLVVGGRVIGAHDTLEVRRSRGGVVEGDSEIGIGPDGRFFYDHFGLAPGDEWTYTFLVDGVLQTDAQVVARTAGVGRTSFTAVAGSCLFTGSMHPVFDRIMDHDPNHVSIAGDLNYVDATTASAWWAGMVSSLNAMRGLPRKVAIRWTPDNHDTIRTDPLGGGALALPPLWKQIAGDDPNFWASEESVGQAWFDGRVLFIQPDMRSARDNYQTGSEPRELFGAAQRAWLTGLLTLANTDESVAMVVWYSSWIGLQQGSGRFGSYPTEYAALKSVIDARPRAKSRLVMVAGDTHNLWADSGARSWPEAAFPGIPSLNVSGFNRASPAETFFVPDIANATIMTSGAEADWGAYSLLTFTEVAGALEFTWEAKRVNAAGVEDTLASWSRTFTDDDPGPEPEPIDTTDLSYTDAERAYLLQVSGLDPKTSIGALHRAVYGTNPHGYFAAHSGLARGSLADHRVAYYRAELGVTGGGLSDLARAFFARELA